MKTIFAILFISLYSFTAKASPRDTIFYQNKLIKAIKMIIFGHFSINVNL